MAASTPVPGLAALGSTAGAAIARHMDTAFRAAVRGGERTESPTFLRLITGQPHPFGNFAVVSGTVSGDALRTIVEPLASLEAPAAVIFTDSEVPGDVGACLAELGFAAHGQMPAMGVDIPRLAPTTLPEGYEFMAVAARDAAEWAERFAVGYELPLGVAECFSPGAANADPALRFYAIRRAGAIVCTSACHLNDGLAGIYCVSTIPDERRKGLGAHATAEPLRLAAREGYRVGVLQSSVAGHGVYRGLGFADYGGIPLYVRMPG